MAKFDHKKIEQKWAEIWEKTGLYNADDKAPGEKLYHLVMFPYPSGDLHIGHWYNYSGADFRARYKKMQGFNILSPIGFDAFGLPAENAAIKRNIPPEKWTYDNISTMTTQLKTLGAMFDWSRSFITADPEYYKWTQWFFLFMYKNGLAYKKKVRANWCPKCQTVLANEQVIGSQGTCDRCDTVVVQKDLEQWLFKITDYAEELLAGLDKIDWPLKTKTMQKNWIGKSEGAEVKFVAEDPSGKAHDLWVFTTRPDTLFGATFMVLAPENPLVGELTDKAHEKEVQKYIEQAERKTELSRLEEGKNKTGVFTGSYAANPISGEKIPVWVGDYVLMTYGHGAIMAVPAHDERDFEFAKKFGLEIKPVIVPTQQVRIIESNEKAVKTGSFAIGSIQEAGGPEKNKEYLKDKLPFESYGLLIDSGKYTDLHSTKAFEKIIGDLEKKGLAKKATTYRLRDWLISRQRYWGAPIPIIFCEKCGEVPVAEKDLPIVLPKEVKFKPTGESPLKSDPDFVNTKCPKCGGAAKRETDTMDTFVCSSWYYYRFADHKNDKQFAAGDKIKTWLPVDMYVGGAEHSVLHLLYSRFFTKVLKDQKYIDFDEPFQALRHQGIILGPNGQKMSKSKGNVVAPDEWVAKVGADTIRMYLGFMGPYDQGGPWNPKGVMGVRRFLDRAWGLYQGKISGEPADIETQRILAKTVNKVGEDINNFHFNTAVSALMILVNHLEKQKVQYREVLEKLALILAPFAPFISEEMWEILGNKESIHRKKWPTLDKKLLEEEVVTIVIQVNGKVRASAELSKNITQKDVEKIAFDDSNVQKFTKGKKPKKVIYVPGKILNIVI